MNILVFAPHPDDELLGCGGTILKHLDKGDDVYVCVVTKGYEPLFRNEFVEKTRHEQKLSHEFLGIRRTFYLDFPSVCLEEEHRYEVNKRIQDVINEVKPTVVYMPHYGDMQKDHEIVADSIMVSVRPRGDYSVKKVYAYETLSETEWNYPYPHKYFMPQRYVDISKYIDSKCEALNFFTSQLQEFPAARSIESVKSLAKLRGSAISVIAAEAFMVIREIE